MFERGREDLAGYVAGSLNQRGHSYERVRVKGESKYLDLYIFRSVEGKLFR